MGTTSSKRPPSSSGKHSFNHAEASETDDEYRAHLMHCIFKEIWSANFRAPVDAVLQFGASVLDIGCGAGTWVNDMASDYRSSRFTGIDMLPLFPTVAKPFNVNFVQADVSNGLPFEDNTFDYIHCRSMIFDFMECQWDFIYKEIYRVLKPGGWIEVVESEIGFVSEGPYTRGVVEAVRQTMESRKINPLIISRHESLLRSMPNLHHISHKQKNYKIGSRSGKIGEQLSSNLCETFKEFLLNFDGKVEVDIDLHSNFRPTSLGGAYNGAFDFEKFENHKKKRSSLLNNEDKSTLESEHKRKSGLSVYKRRSGMSNKENNAFSAMRRMSNCVKRESNKIMDDRTRSSKAKLLEGKKNDLDVEMIVERISKEFELYQSMTLMHRFWAQKVNVITLR